jgi:hypothetical protein
MNASPDIRRTFIDASIAAFESQKWLADKAIRQLPDAALHQPLDENTNSIAVIMKHLAGNFLSRWTDFLTSDGEKPSRNRDGEFVDDFQSRDELIQFWERGWKCVIDSLKSLTPDDLGKTIYIRKEPHGVIQAVQRSLAHAGYHAGQIVQVARILAKDNWETITIARGASNQFNQKMTEQAKQEKR